MFRYWNRSSSVVRKIIFAVMLCGSFLMPVSAYAGIAADADAMFESLAEKTAEGVKDGVEAAKEQADAVKDRFEEKKAERALEESLAETEDSQETETGEDGYTRYDRSDIWSRLGFGRTKKKINEIYEDAFSGVSDRIQADENDKRSGADKLVDGIYSVYYGIRKVSVVISGACFLIFGALTIVCWKSMEKRRKFMMWSICPAVFMFLFVWGIGILL